MNTMLLARRMRLDVQATLLPATPEQTFPTGLSPAEYSETHHRRISPVLKALRLSKVDVNCSRS